MKNTLYKPKVFLFVSLISLCLLGLLVGVGVLLVILQNNLPSTLYSSFLKFYLFRETVPILILGVVGVLVGWYFFKKMDGEIIETWMGIVWLLWYIFVIFYLIFTISIYCLDIQKQDYIHYTGSFKKDSGREFIFLEDKNSTRLRNSSETFLESGNYYGTVVYAKRSKHVLSCSLNNGENDSVVDS